MLHSTAKFSLTESSIHNDKEKIKGLIGYVSQDDLLIEELTVFENLYYNAKLCFDNLTDEEIVTRVDSTLKNLGLIRNTRYESRKSPEQEDQRRTEKKAQYFT